MLLKKLRILLLSTLLLSGCAAEHTLDEWRREELREKLKQLQPIEGVFRGLLKNGETALGGLELSFQPQISVIAGGPGEKAQASTLLPARLVFDEGQRRMALTAPDSFFDPESGEFEVSLTLTRTNGRTERVRIGGTLWKDQLRGVLETSGYPESGTQFLLERNSSASLAELASRASGASIPPGFGVPGNFVEGVVEFRSPFAGGQAPALQARRAKLVIIEPDTSPEETFLNRFAPLRVVQMSLNFGDAFRLVHEGALWDERTRTLRGRAQLGETQIQSECVYSQTAEWLCTHWAAGFGQTATSRFPSSLTSEPSESGSEIHLERHGFVTLHAGEKGAQRNQVWLQVNRGARSRSEELTELFIPSPERNATVSLQFGLPDSPQSERVTVVFENARIDLNRHTLDGVAQLRAIGAASGSIIEVRLQCTHFLLPPEGEMKCQYTSTQLGGALYIEFKAG